MVWDHKPGKKRTGTQISMAAKIAITFSESALYDLQEIVSYYEEQAIPHIGKELMTDIIHDIELLSYQPDMGRVVPEFEIFTGIDPSSISDSLPKRKKTGPYRSDMEKREASETALTT